MQQIPDPPGLAAKLQLQWIIKLWTVLFTLLGPGLVKHLLSER